MIFQFVSEFVISNVILYSFDRTDNRISKIRMNIDKISRHFKTVCWVEYVALCSLIATIFELMLHYSGTCSLELT